MVCLPSCILARSDCASSAKSIAFDDCSDMSEKIIHVTVPTVLVTFVVTDLATLPSQCWLTRLASRIPKNNIERGEGGKRRIFSTWL